MGATSLRPLWLLLALALPGSADATPRIVAAEELRPQARHERATDLILRVIAAYHYESKPVDDRLSSRILDNYLDNMDSNRDFFLSADIRRFEQRRHSLDDALKNKNLTPAFEIFRLYRQRVEQRYAHARRLLEQPFDFSVNESYRFDRRETDWAETEAALNETWRKKVKNDYLNLKLAGKDPDEIRATLRSRYERARTSVFQFNADDVFQAFINSYTTAVDPHTSYLSPRSSQNFEINMSLSLEGIGAVLGADRDHTVVQEVIPGGPAELSGLLDAKDRIIGVGQGAAGGMVDVIGWRLDDVVDLIRGPKGSVVRLEILPEETGLEGRSEIIALTRDKIKLENQAARSDIIELDEGGKLGVIRVPTFYSGLSAQARGKDDYHSTAKDVKRLLTALRDEHCDGLIIDLRGNGGGSLLEALELTGMFIEAGPVVQTRDAEGRIEINLDPDPDIVYGGPLAVLVNRHSASAAEIFAGAMQDYQRGVIVGEPTFGKGTVQNFIDLDRIVEDPEKKHGRVKLTIAQFFRISGGSNQRRGVVPDIILPTAKYSDEHGERSLKGALPWDAIKPARYARANAPVENYAVARERHQRRMGQHRLFQLLLEELEAEREAESRKVVTLLEDRRRAQREQRLAATEEFHNAWRAEQGLPPLPARAAGDAALPEEAEETEAQDVLLEETARILRDLIALAR